MEWWDDDPELLGATLGMLAAWHDGGSGSGGTGGHGLLKRADRETGDGTDSVTSTHSSSSSSDSDRHGTTTTPSARSDSSGSSSTVLTTAAPNSRTVNVSRERRKHELQVLRDKVASLQRQLSALRDRRSNMLRPHFRDPHNHQLASMVPVWENMATRQFQARRKAEIRNSKLKLQLQTQVRVAQELMRVIQRAHEHSPAAMLVPRMATIGSFRMSREDQQARLDRICTHWPDAYALSPKFCDRGPLQFIDMQVTKHNDGNSDDETSATTAVIDVFSSQVLPYSIERVEDVMWSMFTGERGGSEHGDNTWDQNLTGTDDTLSVEFTSTSTMGGAVRGTLSGNWIIKRFSASDHTSRLVVSHAFMDPSGFQNELDSACVDDESWARLVGAHTLGHTHLPQPLTVIQHVRRMRIAVGQRGVDHAPTTSAPHRRHLESATQWFAKQMDEELAWAQTTLENTLMDRAMKATARHAAAATTTTTTTGTQLTE